MPSSEYCDVTHKLLLSGTCPWCRVALPDQKSGDVKSQQWSIPAILKALDDKDKEVRMTVVFLILKSFIAELVVVIPLLQKAIYDSDCHVRNLAGHALASRGKKISETEAESFESGLTNTSNEIALHILLLGYYFRRALHFPSAEKDRRRHLLWIIENVPELEIAGQPEALLSPFEGCETYEKAKTTWLKSLERNPDNIAVLENASNFFFESPSLVEPLLHRARALDPDNPKWLQKLAQLHSGKAIHLTGTARLEEARKILSLLESSLALLAN